MSLGPDDIDFRRLAAQAPVAWSVIDLHGHQVVGNEAYAELLGYTMEQVATLRVTDITHPDDLDLTRGYLDDLVAGRIDRYETDKRYVRSDGSTFVGHLVASVLRDGTGTAIGLVGVITDVTEARALADRVSRSEDRLSKMLTNISDTVTLVGADGGIRATSGNYTSVLGQPPEFWEDRSIFDMVHPDEADRANDMATELLATPGAEVSGEFRLRHHDGHLEDVEVTAVNLLHDPSVEAVIMTSRNITARKESERALLEMRDQALRLAERRVGFVANVSHELRSPLHAVMGLSELLADSSLSAEQREQVQGIQTEARHLHQTVDDLLDYARIEAAGVDLEVGPVDLRSLVERVVARGQSSDVAAAAGLRVRGEVADTVPPAVMLDGHRVEQVLTNLVGNAVKFTAAGSVEVTVTARADWLVLSVADTGAGIPAEHLDDIFEPFHQVPRSTPTVGGSGLGLALVAGLVALMGGQVSVDSTLGEGSTLTVELPLVPSDDLDSGASPQRPSGFRSSEHAASVLVVEDTPVNQMLITSQLSRLGHRCTVAGTATEGLDLLATEPPDRFDLVLMDWQLPDIDGLEATRRLRAAERARGVRIPVVAVTASAMPEDRAACRAAGMDDFLAKPVTLSDLDVVVRRWAGAPSERRLPPAQGTRRLDNLVIELGDPAPVVALVVRYLEELDGRIATIAAADERDDLEVLHSVGHTLRSTSEMLGATELCDACRRLEHARGDEETAEVVAEVRRTAIVTRTMLEGWLAEPGVTA